MFKSKQSHSHFLEGILLGSTIGAVSTFLFGTNKGKKIQKELVSKYKKLSHKIEKAAKSPVGKKIKKAAKRVVKKAAKRVVNATAVKRARKAVRRHSAAKRKA